MRARRNTADIARLISCIFMMLALAWLTISLPVVYAAQQMAQEKKTSQSAQQQSSPEEETDSQLVNTTEEKTPSGSNSFSEEYHLHDSHSLDHFTTELSFKYHIEHYSTYIAFYGDLETPPPNQA